MIRLKNQSGVFTLDHVAHMQKHIAILTNPKSLSQSNRRAIIQYAILLDIHSVYNDIAFNPIFVGSNTRHRIGNSDRLRESSHRPSVHYRCKPPHRSAIQWHVVFGKFIVDIHNSRNIANSTSVIIGPGAMSVHDVRLEFLDLIGN